jgi:ABC-type branched-subunit amino acid transport system ATPase component/predicted MFS family arabinose efflux permease
LTEILQVPVPARRWTDYLRPSVLTGGEAGLPLMVLAGVIFFDQFDKGAFSALTPEIQDFFGLDITGVSLLVILASLLVIILTVPVGFLADRSRRTWITGAGAMVLAVFAAMSGLAPAILLFAIARAGAGINQATNAAHYSLMSDWYPPAVRPGVFAFRQAAFEAGTALGPLVAGLIAAVTLWQVTFVVEAVPLAGLAWFAFVRLREPARGEQERKVQGLVDQAIDEDRPPSFGESLRISWSVRTLRRIIFAIPFLVGAGLGLATLLSIYYDRVFNVGPGLRGVVLAVPQPFAFLGLLVGGIAANRFLAERPARVVGYAGLMGVVAAVLVLGIAWAPNLATAVALSCLLQFAVTILGPATLSLLSLVVTPRARSFALSLGALAAPLGYLFFFLSSLISDHLGIRAGIAVLSPVLAVGTLIVATAATTVAPDIRAAAAATLAAVASRDAKRQGRAQLLVVRDLDVSYGPVQVLFNVDFDVEEGEVVALLGTNGAGKSTLLRAVSGLSSPANGAVFFDGEDITHLPPHEHVARGIVSMPGGKGTFPSLTVGENLRLAQWDGAGDVEEVLETFPELRRYIDTEAGSLSGGEQQMLALGQALLSRPRLLMIDELSLGLSPAVVGRLIDVVRRIHAGGTTIILVEQSVNVALTMAHRAVFMEKGEVRFSGPTAELMERTDILRSVYLRGTGRARSLIGSFETSWNGDAADAERPALEVHGLRKAFGGVTAVDDVSFDVAPGQILGLIGPNGAGKTSLFDLISGFTTADSGRVVLLGEDVTGLSPDQRSALGLVRSFQDARLFPALTVIENLAVALDRRLPTRSATFAALHLPNVSRGEARIRHRVERLVETFGLGALADKFVRELSTGQRRLVDMAAVVATEPKVLLLDEPSSGIAQREAEELGPLLRRIQQETGCSMLVIEHDMPLLLSVAAELVALEQGAVVTRGPAEQVLEHPRVIASYLGTSEEAINRSVRSAR